MPRGSLPGERRGGRQPGTLNKATIERRELAALEAKKTYEHAKLGQKLAKHTLAEMLHTVYTLAEIYKPTDPIARKKNPHGNEKKFEKWLRFSLDIARALAPFQSPTLKAIAVPRLAATDNDGYEPSNPDAPVVYPTVAEIRAKLAARGLPPLAHILDEATDGDEVLGDHFD